MTGPQPDLDRLRDLLEQTAPRSPDLTAPERAAAVVRRGRAARTRDRVLVGGAAAAVLAVAVLVPVLRGDDDPRRATPAPPATVAAPCPSTAVDVTALDPVPALDGVVAVRSCPTTEAPDDALPTEPLLDAAAAAFLEDVEAMPAYQMPPACMVMSIKAEPWALQLQTASGATFLLGDPMRACSAVKVAGTARAVDQVVAAFRGNLAGTPKTLACPTSDDLSGLPTWNASFDPATAVAGIVCGGSTRTDLTADEVGVIGDDLAANLVGTPDQGQCYEPPGSSVLLLADAQGDQVAFLGQTCTTQLANARGYWTPGPAAAAVLSR